VIAFALPALEAEPALPPVELIDQAGWDALAAVLWDAAEQAEGAGDQNQASSAEREQDQNHRQPQG
jgi:hypothetical protein